MLSPSDILIIILFIAAGAFIWAANRCPGDKNNASNGNSAHTGTSSSEKNTHVDDCKKTKSNQNQ